MISALRVLFPGFLWWLGLLIPLVALAFYPTYFSRLLSAGGLFHVHFGAWMLWIVLLVVQPFLIFKGSLKVHRFLGKITYFLAPAIAVTTWMVISRTATAMIQSDSHLSALEKESIFIPVLFLAWFAVFYVMAIVFRRRNVDHATYMFSSALTILGPTLDRILFQVYKHANVGFNVFAEFFTFVVIDTILVALLVYQFRKGYATTASIISIGLFLAGQTLYLFLPDSEVWEKFIRTLFN